MAATSPAHLPRHLTRLAVKITAAGDLALRLHAAERFTWFVGDSSVTTSDVTTDLLEEWATSPRDAVAPDEWYRRVGEPLSVPTEAWAPLLWEPTSVLEGAFRAAFAERHPPHGAGREFGALLATALADFLQRSQDAARTALAEGWAERAQVRLNQLRGVVDPSQQRRAGTLASQVGSELRAVGFMALAPTEPTRRLYQALRNERESLYGWGQALARLGISAPRGSGRYP